MAKKPLDDPKTGIHRAKTWEIGLYALNNTSTNIYLFSFMAISYFLTGFVGITVVLAGSITTLLRMWDGVTDPFIGVLIDKTQTKFGKNRPFLILGNIILAVFSGLIFWVVPVIPKAVRFPAYIILYMLYIIGYTFQCCVTKSAQTCMTNDPEQRPVFSMFNTVFNALLGMTWPMITVNYLVPKYTGADGTSAYANVAFYREQWFIVVIASAVMAILACIGISRKDNPKYFGTGVAQKLGFKDYWDVMKNNRAIQMMIVATCTDKVANSMKGNTTVMMMLFAVICGNLKHQSAISAMMTIPTILVSLALYQFVARKMGLKTALLTSTYGGMIAAILMGCLLIFGDPTQLGVATGNWNLFTIAFLALWLLWNSCVGVGGDLGITMSADCADYEVYRSGKYVPGLMGTLFSFIDKMISSLATTFVALLFAAIGFKDQLPDYTTAYSDDIFRVTLICFIVAPLIGWCFNIVAMKFYPLTKEKMEEVQIAIADIKRQATAAK
ncbi:MAG: MFS transporter [Oscillospiraceae bacterium]|nr:MFS transporter [Oscillospiraceae bacterium]